MKRLWPLVPVFICSALTLSGFAQSRNAPQKAVAAQLVISDWARHAGLHYLDLLDNNFKAHSDFLQGSADSDGSYGKLLDDEEKSLNIDARGGDRVFVSFLVTLRSLAFSYMREATHSCGTLDDCATTRLRARYYFNCRALVESLIDKGNARGSYGECETTHIEKQIAISKNRMVHEFLQEQAATNRAAVEQFHARARRTSAGQGAERRHLTESDLNKLVEQRKASYISLSTGPNMAEVYVDGEKIGSTPIDFVLLKHDDPRVITIKRTGFKTVERTLHPDGNDVVLSIALQ